MYLRRWVDTRQPPPITPFLWIYTRGAEAPKRRSPKNFAYQRGFYRVRNEFLFADDPETIEKDLARIESATASAIREIERRDIVPFGAPRHALAAFIGALELRTEKAEQSIARRLSAIADQPPERLLDMIDGEDAVRTRLLEHGAPPEQVTTQQLRQLALVSARNVADSRDSRLRQLIQTGTSIAKVLVEMNWCVATAPVAATFITSDAPVLIPESGPPREWWEPRGVGFAQEGAEVMLPLDPARLLIVTAKPAPLTDELTREQVDRVNAWTIASAFRHVICHRSRPQVARLVAASLPPTIGRSS